MQRGAYVIVALLIAILYLALPSKSYAQSTIQITSITRASNSNIGSGTDIPIIYGGVAGLDCVAPSSTSTCNNCAADDLGCNTRRIHPGLLLRIQFTYSGTVAGNVYYGVTSGGTTTALPLTADSGSMSQGESGFIEVAWSELCSYTDAGGSCEDFYGLDSDDKVDLQTYLLVAPTNDFANANKVQITVSIRTATSGVLAGDADPGNTITCADEVSIGICSFNAFAGDEKVTIDELGTVGACTNTNYPKALVFYAEDDGLSGASVVNYASPAVELSLGADCTPTGDWVVDGLQNGKRYFFRLAMLDAANNSVLLTDVAGEIIANNGTACTAGSIVDAGCPYYAEPGNVVGLFPEDMNCFISTAAFGSSFNDKVETFRKFRNLILLKSSFGKIFIEKYYAWGPYASRYIADKPILRAATRAALLPLWAYAWLSLHYGWVGALFIVVFFLGLAVYFVNIGRATMKVMKI